MTFATELVFAIMRLLDTAWENRKDIAKVALILSGVTLVVCGNIAFWHIDWMFGLATTLITVCVTSAAILDFS